jgi:anti-anti-sigma factor
MATKALDTSVRDLSGVAIIDLRGEIDSFGEDALNEAYAEAERRGTAAILLNFAGVEYINSTGIALIVGLMARARKASRRLMTTGLSSHYLEIFQITRLADFMNIYPDEATALKQAA